MGSPLARSQRGDARSRAALGPNRCPPVCRAGASRVLLHALLLIWTLICLSHLLCLQSQLELQSWHCLKIISVTWFESPVGNTFPLNPPSLKLTGLLRHPQKERRRCLEHSLQFQMLKSFRFRSAHNVLRPESITRYDTVHPLPFLVALSTQKQTNREEQMIEIPCR